MGKLKWVKRSVINNPENLRCKKYVCKVVTEFTPKQTQKIFKRNVTFTKQEIARKFIVPPELKVTFKGKPIRPEQKIIAPAFVFKDKALYNITYTDKAHGFVADDIIGIAEDNEQNMWLATSAGLIKYDGNYYYLYTTQSGLVSNSITGISFDKYTGLWVATDEGVEILRNDSVFEPVIPGIKNSNLNVVKTNTDSHQNIWINTYNCGAFKFDVNRQTVRHFDTSCGLPFNYIQHVVVDKRNNYWFAGKGLVKAEGSRLSQWFSGKHYFNDDQWSVMLEDADTMWVGTFDNCIFKITPNDTTQFSIYPTFIGRVFDIRKSKGALWFTLYGGGLGYLRGNDYLVFNEANGLSGDAGYCLTEDTYGNIWAGTIDGGISRVNDVSIMMDNTAPKFLHATAAIKKDKDGNRWFFVNGRGIRKETPAGYELITNKPQKPLPSVYHFMNGILDDDGSAWLASYSYGIARYNKKQITFYYYSDDPVSRVVLSAAMGSNHVPWFATMNYGLIYCRDTNFYRVTTANGLLTDKDIRLETDKQGALICLSEKGMQKISNDTVYDLYLNDKMFNFSPTCYHTTLNGEYLIGTSDKGLLLVRDNTLYALGGGAADYYSTVTAILEDSAGSLWLTYGNGIVKAKRNGLTISTIRAFSSKSVLLNKLNNAGYMDDAGVPHWSADNSFLTYKPELQNNGVIAPALKYLNATINGNEVGVKNAMTLYPNDMLNLYYSAICWGYENELTQKYALINKNGSDTIELSPGENGFIKINNLGAGDYSVVLIAGIGNRKYYSEPLNLTVNPYWYNTPWFYASCAVLMAVGVFGFFRYRNQQLQKAKQDLEKIVAERTADLTTSLGERNILLKEIHHRVKNNLQVISGLLELQKDEIVDEKVKAALSEGQSRVRSVALIHHNLYQHENLASIHFKLFVSDLVRYLGEVFEEKSKKMIVDVIGEDAQLDIDTAVPLGLIINELLTNAYKYGAPEDGVATVMLELKKISDAQYQLTYKDNGPGIKGEIKFDSATSLGLRLIKGLIAQIGGTVTYSYNAGSVFTFIFKDGEARKKE